MNLKTHADRPSSTPTACPQQAPVLHTDSPSSTTASPPRQPPNLDDRWSSTPTAGAGTGTLSDSMNDESSSTRAGDKIEFDGERDKDLLDVASTQAIVIEELLDRNEGNVQLPNEDIDECNPDDTLDGMSGFLSDDDDELNDIEFLKKFCNDEIQKYNGTGDKEDNDHEGVGNDKQVADLDKDADTYVVDIESDNADNDHEGAGNDKQVTVLDKDADIVAVDVKHNNEWLEDISEDHDELFPEDGKPEEISNVLVHHMQFPDRVAFKKHLRTYVVLNKFQYKLTQADKNRVRVECKYKKTHGCQFKVTARKIPKTDTFSIRKVILEHTCLGLEGDKNPSCNSTWIAEQLLKRLRVGSVVPKPQEIIDEIWGSQTTVIPYWVAWEARDKVLETLHGNYDDSYSLVPSLCKMITEKIEGSIASFSIDKEENTFESLCVSFSSQLEGFVSGCRPVIGLDGCHLKGKYGGVLLSATTLDAGNNLYPLAIFICRNECYPNWHMFLKLLQPKITNHASQLTFISDRQKGLLDAVEELYPGGQHRYCLRHLYKNFKVYYKDYKLQSMLWNAATAFKERYFKGHMEKMLQENVKAFKYLMEDCDPRSWARCYFDKASCCEHLNNNFSESFNNMISKLRDKPVCTIVRMYASLVMELHHKRSEAAKMWEDGAVVPKGMKLIDKMKANVGEYDTQASDALRLYQVTSKHKSVFTVSIVEKTCSCLQWQLRGFSCQHGVCVLNKIRPNWNAYCHWYYSVDAYRTTYAHPLPPLRDTSDWEKPSMKVLPPILMRKTGRPSTSRKKSWTETVSTKKARACSLCKAVGHNKQTCAGGEVGSNPKKKKERTEVDGETFAQSTYTPTTKQQRAKATCDATDPSTYISASSTPTASASSNKGGRSKGRRGRGFLVQNLSQNIHGGTVNQSFTQSAPVRKPRTKKKKLSEL